MKAKTKKGNTLLDFNSWSFDKEMVINFINKGTYIDFHIKKNHLFIDTSSGVIEIVFTGEMQKLRFKSYCKDQLILVVI